MFSCGMTGTFVCTRMQEMCACVCVRVRACMRVHVCVRACVHHTSYTVVGNNLDRIFSIDVFASRAYCTHLLHMYICTYIT